MKPILRVIRWSLSLSLLLSLILVPARAQDTRPHRVRLLKSCQLQPGSPRQQAIPGDSVRYQPAPDKDPVTVPVTLREQFYSCRFIDIDETGNANPEHGGHLCLYQLSPTNDSSFAWSIWSLNPMGHFRLFTAKDGPTWLTWVDGPDVKYVEITGPNDALEQLPAFLQSSGEALGKRIPAVQLIGRENLKDRGGRNALYCKIEVLSFGKGTDGRMTATIAGVTPGSVHTLVEINGTWDRLIE